MFESVRISLRAWNGAQLGLVAGLACAGVWWALPTTGADAPREGARIAARSLALAIDGGLRDIDRDARSAGLLVKDTEAVLPEAGRAALLQRWLGLHPAYAHATLVDADGRIRVAAGVRAAARDLSSQPWFRRARRAETVIATEGGSIDLVVALADGDRLVLRVGPDWLADLDARLRAGLPGDASGLALAVTGADGEVLSGHAPRGPLAGRIVETAQTAGSRALADPGWSVTAIAPPAPSAGTGPDRRTVLLVLGIMLAGAGSGYALGGPPARRLRRLAATAGDPTSESAPPAGLSIAEIDDLERAMAQGMPRHERADAHTGFHRARARLATFEAMSGWRLWEIDPQTHRVIWSDSDGTEPFAGDHSTDLADLVAGIAPADRAAMRLTLQAALEVDGPHDVTLRTCPAAAEPERRLLVRFRRGDAPAGGEARLFALSREVGDGDPATDGDPTERRRDTVLRRVTDGIVHDVNDVLTVILANLGSLKRRHALDAAQTHLVDAAVAGAERGAALTRRMVGFARSGSGGLGEADLAATVAAFLPFLQARVLGEMPVMNRLPAGLPPVLCSERVIEVALLNLAFHFRDAGLDGFAVAGSPEEGGEAPGVRMVIASGRPARLVPAPSTEADSHLETVARLLEQSGGHFSLASDGSARPFLAEIRLPAQARGATRAAPAAARLTLLVVESDSLVRASLAGALADLGHRVVQAASGGHALEILAGPERFDGMIADLSMPAMSGLQLAAAVVERHPEVQVIIAGPHGHLPETARRFLNLDKPFRQDDLAAVLAHLGAPAFARAA